MESGSADGGDSSDYGRRSGQIVWKDDELRYIREIRRSGLFGGALVGALTFGGILLTERNLGRRFNSFRYVVPIITGMFSSARYVQLRMMSDFRQKFPDSDFTHEINRRQNRRWPQFQQAFERRDDQQFVYDSSASATREPSRRDWDSDDAAAMPQFSEQYMPAFDRDMPSVDYDSQQQESDRPEADDKPRGRQRRRSWDDIRAQYQHGGGGPSTRPGPPQGQPGQQQWPGEEPVMKQPDWRSDGKPQGTRRTKYGDVWDV